MVSRDKFRLAAAINNVRPPGRSMVGIDTESREILLPTMFSNDLFRLLEVFQIPKTDAFQLYAFLLLDFGTSRRADPPVRVLNASAARAVNIEREFAEAEEIWPEAEVWWQKWGGYVYGFSARENELIEVVTFGCYLGDEHYVHCSQAESLSDP